MDKDLTLQKMHKLEIKIALEIKRICEKNNIRYFLTAGSMLGAVRHGGFIPWDDDMDIGMLREDFNKFLEACKTDLGEEYFLQTWDTDAQYPFSFAKIRLNNTHFVEGFSKQSSMNNGIFVDIFPFDNVPDGKIKRLVQSKKYFICKRLMWIKKGMGQNMKENGKGRIKYYIFLVFSKLFSYNSVKNYFSKIQQKYNKTETEYIVTDGSYSYEKESIKRKWADNLELVRFENTEFMTFKDRLDYLAEFYGDYMQLPPEDKRNRHLAVSVDFGPYDDLAEIENE